MYIFRASYIAVSSDTVVLFVSKSIFALALLSRSAVLSLIAHLLAYFLAMLLFLIFIIFKTLYIYANIYICVFVDFLLMAIEDQLQQSLFKRDSERTFIDKVLAKEEVDRIRELVKKPKLARNEMLELLYLVGGNEAKLLNYSDWDRYLMNKFFVWLREFVKILEMFFDYREYLEGKEKKDKNFKLSSRFRKILDNNQALLEHQVKFLIDLYLNVGRTSLSVGATGFMELLTNKFEMAYPTLGGSLSAPETNKTRIFGKK